MHSWLLGAGADFCSSIMGQKAQKGLLSLLYGRHSHYITNGPNAEKDTTSRTCCVLGCNGCHWVENFAGCST